MSAYIIPTNQHVFIAGRTGTGKTYLTKKYLSGYNHVVALDTKGFLPEDWTEPGEDELTIVSRLADLERVKTPKIIYQPNLHEMTEEHYNEFFRWCYLRKNCLVWIDEVMSVCPSPFKIPFYYQGILTRGRQRNVAAWSLTQRPSGIPQLIMSEASHFFVFDLNLPQDREKLVKVTGVEDFYKLPSKAGAGYNAFNFWYYNVKEDSAVLSRLVESKAVKERG